MSCGVECPNWNPQGKIRSFKDFSRWIFCTPKKTGTPQAALQSKVLDPCTPKKTGTPQAALQSKVLDPCTPKKTGTPKAALRSKVLDPRDLYFCLFVKGPPEMSL